MLLKDINTATDGSLFSDFTNVNGTLFFMAFRITGSIAIELWKSDGTQAGTVRVKSFDLSATPPSLLTGVGDTLFFVYDDNIHGEELWKSDGTEAGTVMVKDIHASGDSLPIGLTDVDGTLFFLADDEDSPTGYGLWKSDGTAAGTVFLKEGYAACGCSGPPTTLAVGSTLFFVMDDGTHGESFGRATVPPPAQ